MANGGSRSFTWLLLAIVSFVIAILSFVGILAAEIPTARWIFGFLFIGIGIFWVVRYMQPPPKK